MQTSESGAQMEREGASAKPAPSTETKDKKDKKARKDKKAKPERAEIAFESPLPLEEAISYFEAIAAGLKKGALQLKQNGNTLRLRPPGHLTVRVGAEARRGRETVSFSLEWQTRGEDDLTISAD